MHFFKKNLNLLNTRLLPPLSPPSSSSISFSISPSHDCCAQNPHFSLSLSSHHLHFPILISLTHTYLTTLWLERCHHHQHYCPSIFQEKNKIWEHKLRFVGCSMCMDMGFGSICWMMQFSRVWGFAVCYLPIVSFCSQRLFSFCSPWFFVCFFFCLAHNVENKENNQRLFSKKHQIENMENKFENMRNNCQTCFWVFCFLFLRIENHFWKQ